MIKKIAAQTMPWLAASSIAAALLLLAAGEALGLVATADATGPLIKGLGASPLLWAVAFFMAACVVAALLVAYRTGCRAQPFRPTRFLPAVIGGGLLLHLLLVAYVQPSWGTDYLRYWQHAQEMVKEHKYGGFSGPYYSRALLVPYVIVRLFGPDATMALKLANIALLAGIQLFAYDILRRVRSHQAAQAASLLLLAAPMPAFATLIPSHDLWGLFFFAATLWTLTLALFPAGGRPLRIARWLPLAMVTGVLAYLTELQRGTGSIFCVALILSCTLYWLCSRRNEEGESTQARAYVSLLVALLSLGSMLVAGKVGDGLGLNPNPRTSLFMMKIAANSGGMGNGKSDWYARFRDRFGEEQATDESATDFAKSMALSAWTLEPIERGEHLAVQAQRLFELHYPADWNWMLRHPKGISKATRHLLIVYAAEYALGLGVWLVWSLCLLATSRRPLPVPVLAALLSILLLSAILLLLFENKPFNIFPIWLAACLAIGCTVKEASPGLADKPRNYSSRKRLTIALSGVSLATGALVIALLVTRTAYGPSSGQLLSDWSVQTSQALSANNDRWQSALMQARPEAFDPASYDPATLSQSYIRHADGDGDRIQRYAGSTVTRMQFPAVAAPGDQLTLATNVCAKDPARNGLEFFAFAPGGKTNAGSMTLTVSVDGRVLEQIGVPFDGRNFQRFFAAHAFERGKCQSLTFQLRATRAVTEHESTPFVELWLPRLVK